jgi:hypothetical protein
MLTTARLRLRPWRDEDLEPFAALNADSRVREFFPSLQTHQESAESMQYIRDHFRHRGFGLWAVEVIGAAPFIGFVGLSVPSFDASFMPCVELGYRLAFDHWGLGRSASGYRVRLCDGLSFRNRRHDCRRERALTTADGARRHDAQRDGRFRSSKHRRGTSTTPARPVPVDRSRLGCYPQPMNDAPLSRHWNDERRWDELSEREQRSSTYRDH